jgi:hypothetical protein
MSDRHKVQKQFRAMLLGLSGGTDQAEDEAKEDEADGVSYSEFALPSAQSVPPNQSDA